MVKRCQQIRNSDGEPAIIAACSLCPNEIPCVFTSEVAQGNPQIGRSTTLADLPDFKAPALPAIDDDSEQAAQANDPATSVDALAKYERWRGIVSDLALTFDVQPVGNIQQRGSIPGTVKLIGDDGYVFDLVDMLDAIEDVIDSHETHISNLLAATAMPGSDTRGKKNARIARLEQEVSRLRHDAEHRSQTIGDLQTRIVRFDKRVADLELTSKGIPVDNTSYVIEEKGDGSECEAVRRKSGGVQTRLLCMLCGTGQCWEQGETNPIAYDGETAPATNWRAEINGTDIDIVQDSGEPLNLRQRTERAIGQIMDRLDEHHVELGKIMPPGGDMPTLAEAWRHIHRLNESALRLELRRSAQMPTDARLDEMARRIIAAESRAEDAVSSAITASRRAADAAAMADQARSITDERIAAAVRLVLLGSSTADGTALEQMGKELGHQITVAMHVALDDLIAAKVAEQIKEMRENATAFAQAATQAHEAIERRRDELERQRITPLPTEAELLAFAGKVLEIVDTGRNETDMADRLVQEASDLRDGRHGVSDPMGS